MKKGRNAAADLRALIFVVAAARQSRSMASNEELQAKIVELEAQVARLEQGPSPGKVPNLAELLRAEKTCYGTLVQSPSPFWVAWGGPFLAKELDFLFIDTEHTPITRHDLSVMCNLYKGQGLPCLVRVTDAEQARQALDGGASGVVAPYMETVDEVCGGHTYTHAHTHTHTHTHTTS